MKPSLLDSARANDILFKNYGRYTAECLISNEQNLVRAIAKFYAICLCNFYVSNN